MALYGTVAEDRNGVHCPRRNRARGELDGLPKRHFGFGEAPRARERDPELVVRPRFAGVLLDARAAELDRTRVCTPRLLGVAERVEREPLVAVRLRVIRFELDGTAVRRQRLSAESDVTTADEAQPHARQERRQ